MRLSALQWLMIAAGAALEAGCLGTIWHRKMVAQLQVLSGYLLFLLIRGLVYVYGLYNWPIRTASWFYWVSEGVVYVLSFLLIMSFWKEALGHVRAIWKVTRWVLPGTLLAFLLFLRWTTGFAPGSPPRAGNWMSDGLHLLGQTLSLTQAVFLLGFFLVIALFSVPVAPLLRRLAACWFVYSLCKVTLLTLRYVLGQEIKGWYDYSSGTAFLALLGVWAVLLWRAQPSELQAPQPIYILQGGSGRLAGQLEAVNRTLSRLLKV